MARKNSTRRGTTAVEFALASPLIFFLLFGAVELARIQFIRHAAENAAYEAARYAITPGATATNARNHAVDFMTRVSARDSTADVTPATLSDSTTEVTVTVSVPLDRNCWISPRFSPGYIVSASSTLKTERYRP